MTHHTATIAQVKEAGRLYTEEGWTCTDLAARFGGHKSSWQYRLKAMLGIKLRKRGESNQRKLTARDAERIIRLRKEGWTTVAIALKVGVHSSTVGHIIRKHAPELSGFASHVFPDTWKGTRPYCGARRNAR